MTLAVNPPLAHQSGRRILTTIRVHAANPWTIIITPWLVLFAVFALNFLIWQAIVIAAGGKELPADAFANNGAVSWLFVYMIVVAVQAMNLTFSFVVGLGATRRDYFLGSAATFAALSAQFGIGIAILAWIERATDGWGLGGAFFAPAFMTAVPVWQVAVVYTLVLLFMFFLGTSVAAVYVRWGATAIVLFFVALALAFAVGALLVSRANAWPAVGNFFVDNSILQLALYTLPLSAICAVLGWLLMRRATPKG